MLGGAWIVKVHGYRAGQSRLKRRGSVSERTGAWELEAGLRYSGEAALSWGGVDSYLGELADWSSAIVRAREFTGPQLERGTHDHKGECGVQNGELLARACVGVSIVTGGIAIPLARGDRDMMLACVLHHVAESFFDGIEAAHGAGVKAVGEDFALAIKEVVDRSR